MIGREAEIRGSMVKCEERLLLEGGERGWGGGGGGGYQTKKQHWRFFTSPQFLFSSFTIPTFHVIFIVSPTPLPP